MSDPEQGELTSGDRLNYPYLVANQILTFQKAILNLEFSESEIREAIEGLVHLIPAIWKDEKFNDEMKGAVFIRQVDVRPVFCGVPPSVEYCEKAGITSYKEEKVFDYYKVFQACVNLLQRRKMLGRIRRIEKLEKIDFERIDEKMIEEFETYAETE